MRSAIKEVLTKAREYVAAGWTTGEAARDCAGVPCSARDPRACYWCVFGAVYRASYDLERLPSGIEGRLAAWELLEASLPEGDSLADWNDAPGRTQEEVVALFDRALEEK